MNRRERAGRAQAPMPCETREIQGCVRRDKKEFIIALVRQAEAMTDSIDSDFRNTVLLFS